MDGTIITVALPDVSKELAVDPHTVSWVITAYFLAFAVTLFPGGRLTDRLGSRQLALAGLALFAAGALIGALAQSFGVLVASRVIQGAGAGLVSPASLAGAVSGFPAERRGVALGTWGASSGIANLIGPLLGGLLTDAWGWRANWWALLPMAAAAAFAMWSLVPREVHLDERPDVAGLRQRVVAAAAAVAALTFVVLIGTFFLAQQYLQQVGGYSALGAAAVLMIVAFLVAAAAPLAGRLADIRGERLPAMAGFAAAALGMFVLGLPGLRLTGAVAIVGLVPVGLGLGFLFVPASRAALNAVPQSKHGRVSAVMSASRLLGGALGSGLAGAAISTGLTTGHVHNALLGAAAICLFLGLPAAAQLAGRAKAPGTAPT